MTTQTLHLESAPLHTEKPKWAAHAPAQVEAACKRGADVIALTELRPSVTPKVREVGKKHGYTLYGLHDTGLLVKDSLKVHSHGQVAVAGRRRTHVTFEFGDSTVTVFGMHWATDKPAHAKDRAEQTVSLVNAAHKAQKAGDFVFVIGDSNPTAPLAHKDGQPRADLNTGGFVLAYEQTKFPRGIGVSVIASYKDPNVKATSVHVHAALGSDHKPVDVHYELTTEPRPAVVQAAVDALAEARAHLEGADKHGGPGTPVDAYWQKRVNAVLPEVQKIINDLLL